MANEITELKKAMANNARVALLNRDGWVLARETKFSRSKSGSLALRAGMAGPGFEPATNRHSESWAP